MKEIKEVKEVLLNKEMQKIVDKNMRGYKSDLELDLKLFLDKDEKSDTYIWVVRETGTHLYIKERLFILEEGARFDYMYFADYKALVYEINVTKKRRSNVYGTIKKLKRDKLTKDIKENSISYEGGKVSLKVTLINEEVHSIEVPVGTNIYEIAELLKVDYQQVKRVNRIKYTK